MGLRFRKSVKLIPGVRLNFTNSGLGLGFGGKGCRVNINKKGVSTTVGAGGLYVNDYERFNKGQSNNKQEIDEAEIQRQENIKNMKAYLKSHYTRHRKFIAWGIFCMICGVRFLPMLVFGGILTTTGILLKIKNRDRIKQEHSK
jgi:hypothetical protein